MSLLAIIGSGLGLLTSILAFVKYFVIKTPEQKEADDLEKLRNHEAEVGNAIKKAETGDPSDLSKLINK